MIVRDDNINGESMHSLLQSLYPICRSITGNGVRNTLVQLQKDIPVAIREVASGTSVFDWTVPLEWNIHDAWIKDSNGSRVVDFQKHNLHVMSYSVPIQETMPLSQLRPHLHSLPSQPDAIPYKTTYYKEDWGFCLSHNSLKALEDGRYEVCIDSTLAAGSLSYGELLLPGKSDDEVLFSSHICHPSLANDNLSGIVVAAALARILASAQNRRYSYRFLFVPATIGAIVWLAHNEATVDRIKHGLVLSGVGDGGPLSYKRSRRSNAPIDRAVEHVLKTQGIPYCVQEFSPHGYDERQYCSPGFNLPVGRLSRTPYGTYREYHTSEDNPNFVRPDSLAQSLSILLSTIHVLEADALYRNTNPKCEPHFGKRGLYQEAGDEEGKQMAQVVLSYSDGQHTLLDIAEKVSIPFDRILRAAELLEKHGLLQRLG
jgi:aminopeptidase-like protein